MLGPGREAVMSEVLGNNTVRGRQPHPSEVAPKLSISSLNQDPTV